jgi:hypothetical protein
VLTIREIKAAGNKNYMSIGVSVRTTKFSARNNGIGVRQESNPQMHIVPIVMCHAWTTVQTRTD